MNIQAIYFDRLIIRVVKHLAILYRIILRVILTFNNFESKVSCSFNILTESLLYQCCFAYSKRFVGINIFH